jgi:ankyrin repeat protein
VPKFNALNLHDAYRRGDLDAVKAALGDPPDFPNCRGPRGMGENVLEYAIYHSPLAFVRKLLDLGANPNYGDHAGFPSLIAALSADRPDRQDLLKLLLDHGADVSQRGVNDYTPLHYAAATNDVPAIELLLARGADPSARTNVDDYATPLEEAERGRHHDAVAALRRGAAQ